MSSRSRLTPGEKMTMSDAAATNQSPTVALVHGAFADSKVEREVGGMNEEQVTAHLTGMNTLDFVGWNNADWQGVFAHQHTNDVYVEFKGAAPTRGIDEHIAAMKAYVEAAGGTPPQVVAHPIAFGSGEWTCVIGEFGDGSRMVTVA